MSQKVVTTCDYCSAPCSGNVYASFWDDGDETRPYKHTRLDGCSQEHLRACIAKAFGMPVDGAAIELIQELRTTVDRKNKLADEYINKFNAAEARVQELTSHAATLTGLANQYKAERDSLEETCRMHSARTIELEKQRDDLLSRKDYDALAFTRSAQYIENLLKHAPKENTEGHEFMAQFVETLRGMAQSITDTTKPTKPAIAKGDHVHEVGSCTHCDTKPAAITPEAIAARFAGDDYGKNDLGCAQVAIEMIRERLEPLAAYWEEGAVARESMPESYPRALKDCAKELRKELSK